MESQYDHDAHYVGRARELLEEARKLADDYGTDVRAAVDQAADQLLADDEAERLFSRILNVLRTGSPAASPGGDARDHDEVARQVRSLLTARKRDTDGGIKLVSKHGMEPHLVTPVPTFNGQPVAMMEGYVDVTHLQLWPENHRIELHVGEFRDLQHRDPEPEELLRIVQGQVHLPSLGKRDPFKILPLAESIARKGVERPPIVTYEGVPKDGNRRIAAARYVAESAEFGPDAKERARWVKVWRAPKGTTEDQFDAVVIALNFEEDHKIEWPEYVKARLVAGRYHAARDVVHGSVSAAVDRKLKKEVADFYGIKVSEVTRYVKMVQWADDFEEYHTEVARREDPAAIRYRANDIFQYFYEIEAGKAGEKLTDVLERDEDLKAMVYDLMYYVLDSGAELRGLHKVIKDDTAFGMLQQAHETWEQSHDAQSRDEARKLLGAAIAEAQKNVPTRALGFETFAMSAAQRFGAVAPDQWSLVASEVLVALARVLPATLGAVRGELATRGVKLGEDVPG